MCSYRHVTAAYRAISCADETAPLLLFIPGIGMFELYAELLSIFPLWGLNVVGVDLRGHLLGGERGCTQ